LALAKPLKLFFRRGVGFASRRLGRPELLAAVDAGTLREQREEIAIRAVLASSLRGDSTYVDVGANQGQVLSSAVRIAPQGHHFAFEPVPSLAAQLRRSFPQVDCRELALAAVPETASFCHFRRLDGWSGLRRSPEVSDRRGEPEYITVRVSTMDAELREVVPSVIKIDVEGAELAVLEGGRTVLARAHPLLIFEHVSEAAALYGADSESIWDLLTGLGYRIYAITGEGPFARSAFAQAATIVNWLAVPSEVRV
jgi:FkbM family methyltransferase